MKLLVIVVVLMASPALAKGKVDNSIEKARCHGMGAIARMTAKLRDKGVSRDSVMRRGDSAEQRLINEVQDWVYDSPAIGQDEADQATEAKCLRLGWYAGAKLRPSREAAASGSPSGDSVKELCSERYPSDYVMQETCIDMQRKAAQNLARWNKEHPEFGNPMSPMGRIIATCWSRYGDNGKKTDFVMLETCINMQYESYQKIR